MTDATKTCGGCAWYKKDARFEWNGDCTYPLTMLEGDHGDTYAEEGWDATDCKAFRSYADAALIAECHRKRSLGIAVSWSDVDRLIELLAGKPLERRKRCGMCYGNGVLTNREPWTAITVSDWVTCDDCHGTGYRGGEK